jgi:16S rRNA (guanine966-N2)-methyltransferase
MAVQAAHVGGWLADGAIVMLEERGGIEVLLPAGVAELDRRVYGDTQIVLARASRRGG